MDWIDDGYAAGRLGLAVIAIVLAMVVRAPGLRAEPQPGDTPAETSAETSAETGDDRPWAEGVSAERQRKAQALYDAGNALLQDFLLAEAVDRYREALGYWNHPGIHYNLAKALYNLGQPLDAYDSILEALRYGPDALQANEYEQARNFRALIEQQTSELSVICDEPGVALVLDGQPLGAEAGIEAGTLRRRLLPGEHLLVANKPGFQTVTRRLRLAPGQRSQITLTAWQRWQPWEPWAVIGYGAAAGLGGALLQWRASVNLGRYRSAFTSMCPDGCRDSDIPALDRLRTRSLWQNRLGLTAMITGGAITLAGAVMAVRNRSRSFRVQRQDVRRRGPDDQDTPAAGLSLTPVLSPDTMGVLAGFSF